MPDILVCTELNMAKGFCTKTISDEEFIIDDTHPHVFEEGKPAQTWWDLRPYMVMLPFPSWAELKIYLIQTCKRTNCDAYVASWERKINHMDEKVKDE